MGDILIFLTGFVTGSFLLLLVIAWAVRRYLRRTLKQIDTLKAAQRLDWDELISRLNHTGKIPIATTALGLIGLVSLATSKLLTYCERNAGGPDFDIKFVTLALRETLDTLAILHHKFGEFIRAQRNHLKDFEYKRNERDPRP